MGVSGVEVTCSKGSTSSPVFKASNCPGGALEKKWGSYWTGDGDVEILMAEEQRWVGKEEGWRGTC